MQAPLLHGCPTGHTWPQVPQLFSSEFVLTHCPLQLVEAVDGHSHVPSAQTSIPGHAFPQPPQLLELEFGSTQLDSQRIVFGAQTQLPPLQTCEAAQTVAQLPQ